MDYIENVMFNYSLMVQKKANQQKQNLKKKINLIFQNAPRKRDTNNESNDIPRKRARLETN